VQHPVRRLRSGPRGRDLGPSATRRALIVSASRALARWEDRPGVAKTPETSGRTPAQAQAWTISTNPPRCSWLVAFRRA
jgi:hypothetical protein